MSTDPTFTVEWTVAADDGRGTDAPEETDGAESAGTERDASAAADDDGRLATRDPEELPPAPELAARVDRLRADRRAKAREADAVRERYETIIRHRNEEIARLRERLEDRSLLARLRRLF